MAEIAGQDLRALLAGATRGIHRGDARRPCRAQGSHATRDQVTGREWRGLVRGALRRFRTSQPRTVDAGRHRRPDPYLQARDQARRSLGAQREAQARLSARPARRKSLDRISTQRRGRRDRAVEFSHHADDGTDRGRVRRGQPGDGEILGIHPPRRRTAGGTGAALLRPRGTGLHLRRPRDRQGLFRAAVRSSHLHRRHGDRTSRAARRGGQPHPGHAGAWRKIAGDRRAQRQRRAGGRADHGRQDDERRPDLPRPRLSVGAGGAGGRGRRANQTGRGQALSDAAVQSRLYLGGERTACDAPQRLSRRRPRQGRRRGRGQSGGRGFRWRPTDRRCRSICCATSRKT